MSIICTEVEDSPLMRKAAYKSASRFVRATIDLKTAKHLPFPDDYEFGSCFLPLKYEKLAARIHNFAVRPSDIWIVGYPKTGTTWMHNILWALKNNLTFLPQPEQLFEFTVQHENANDNEAFQKFIDEMNGIEKFENLPSPRFLKSHLPASLLPKELWKVKPKIIHVTRNPKDTALSLHKHMRNCPFGYSGTREDFLEVFLNDHVIYTPFHEHVLSFWQLRHSENILFVAYEELITETFDTIKRISEYLECSYSDEQLQQLVGLTSTSLNNANGTSFVEKLDQHFRKGKMGGFVDEMNDEMIQRFDDWTKEKLKDSDFKFAL